MKKKSNHSKAELFGEAIVKGEVKIHPRYTLKDGKVVFESFDYVYVGKRNTTVWKYHLKFNKHCIKN